MRNLNPFRFLRRFRFGQANPNVRGALAFSTAQQYTDFLISFPAIMILSRLLTPAEIGVYSVCITFVNIVHMLRDMGTSEYLVQAERVDDGAAQSAFTINFLIAWFLAAVLFLISPLLADFFNEAGVGNVLKILALTFLFLPIGSIANAMLIREMQFGIRYKISIAQLIIQNGLTIALAWWGFSYYSPAWGAVAGVATTALGSMVWAREYRIRGVGLSHWRAVTSFGLKKTTETVMNQLGAAAPDFVIGRMLGLAQVGLFSRGFGLPRMFRQNVVGAIGAVSYSTYARHHREGKDPGKLYLKKITLVTGFGWPCLGFASLFAYPIMMIFFGHQWEAAVPILRLMAIFTCIGITVIQYQALLTAIGRPGMASLATLMRQTLLVLSLIIGATVSLYGVAVAYVIVGLIMAVLTIAFMSRYTSLSLTRYVAALWPSARLAVWALVPAAVVRFAYPPASDRLWLPILLGGLCWLIGYGIGLRRTGHPLWHELQPVLAKLRSRRAEA